MPALRRKSYDDYGLSQQDIEFLLAYCRSKNSDKNLIQECARYSNSGISEYLSRSVLQKRSYEHLGYVPIGKVDFYAYRRKMLADLKRRLQDRGDMLIIGGQNWSWFLIN